MADKAKKTVENVKQEAGKVATEVKQEAGKAVEEVKAGAKKAVTTAKKAEKKTADKAKKTAAKTKATAKRVAAAASAEVYVQFNGGEKSVTDLVEAAKADFKASHKRTKVEDLKLYVVPETSMVYYVVNGDEELRGEFQY